MVKPIFSFFIIYFARCMRRTLKIFIIIVFLIIQNKSIYGQGVYKWQDKYYASLLNIKTSKIEPTEQLKPKVHRVLIIKPFVEYRYYRSKVMFNVIDSAFASRAANNDSSYVIFPNKMKLSELLFKLKLQKAMQNYTDTLAVELDEKALSDVKSELRNFIKFADSSTVSTYHLNSDLSSWLSASHFDHILFNNVLIYQIVGYPPNFFIRLTSFVFEIKTKKLFFYESYNCSSYIAGRNTRLDLPNDKNLTHTIMGLTIEKKVLDNYKKYLKPSVKDSQ